MTFSHPKIPKWIIEKQKEWNELKNSSPAYPSYSNEGRMNIPVTGFDTETLDGYTRLIAASDRRYLYLSDSSPDNLDKILDFLSSPRYNKSLNFFFNIDFDVAAMLKYLPGKNLKQLYSLNRTEYKKWIISYVPRKAFTIRTKGRSYKYFDLWQYYRSSLEKAAKEYISSDLSKDPVDRERLGTDKNYWDRNLKEIINYCIKDCKLTQKLGEIMQQKLNALNISFDNPYSTGTISIRYFSQFYRYPRFKPTEWNRYAYLSYYGGRFEIIQKGYFDRIIVQDVVSAYPYQMANLIDIRKGEWLNIKNLNEDADIGFYKIVIEKSSDHPIQPLGYRNSGLVFYPEINNSLHYTTQDELLFALDNYDDIEIKILDGWEFHADKISYPFEKMREIFSHRKKIKESDPILQLVLKIIMNSKYGKMAEKTRKIKTCKLEEADDIIQLEEYTPVKSTLQPGSVFNPVYASLITARTRVMLLEHAVKKEDDVAAMFTDSILSTRKIVDENKELGGWSIECKGEGLIIGCGVYTIRNQNEGFVKTRLRGIHSEIREGEKDNGIDLFEIAERNRNRSSVEIEWKKSIRPKEAILFKNKYSIEDINRFIKYSRELNVQMDKKRMWHADPSTFGQLLTDSFDSSPLIVK